MSSVNRCPIRVCRRYRRPSLWSALRRSISGTVSREALPESEFDEAVEIQTSARVRSCPFLRRRCPNSAPTRGTFLVLRGRPVSASSDVGVTRRPAWGAPKQARRPYVPFLFRSVWNPQQGPRALCCFQAVAVPGACAISHERKGVARCSQRTILRGHRNAPPSATNEVGRSLRCAMDFAPSKAEVNGASRPLDSRDPSCTSLADLFVRPVSKSGKWS
jgi:hypothetical protein